MAGGKVEAFLVLMIGVGQSIGYFKHCFLYLWANWMEWLAFAICQHEMAIWFSFLSFLCVSLGDSAACEPELCRVKQSVVISRVESAVMNGSNHLQITLALRFGRYIACCMQELFYRHSITGSLLIYGDATLHPLPHGNEVHYPMTWKAVTIDRGLRALCKQQFETIFAAAIRSTTNSTPP